MEQIVIAGFVIFALLLIFGFIGLYSVLVAKLNHLQDNLPAIQAISTRLEIAEKATRESFERLAGNLGQLSEATQNMLEVGKTITSLEDLLKPPKLRGGMGETLLAELLNQILPKEFVEFQYAFKSGEKVDAVIHLGDALVPVDSKFPLENFRKLVASTDNKEADNLRKSFLRDVKLHIEKISKKYILPDEKTFDFALMYIPAENVYYETIIKDDTGEGLFPFALEKKVIPVSPNSFYAYLQVIIRGLKGLHIEKKAQEILAHLARLEGEEAKVREDFNVLGRHLSNAQAKYNDAGRSLDRFEDKLLSIGENERVPELPSEIK